MNTLRIPFKWYPPQEIIKIHLYGNYWILQKVTGTKIDGVITTKFPSFSSASRNSIIMVVPPASTRHMICHFTQFDDLTPYIISGEIVKKNSSIDKISLKESRKIFSISQNVTNRLAKIQSYFSELLISSPPFMGKYYCKNFDNYILYPSRLDSLKRQELVIKSMKFVNTDIRLKIVGKGPQLANI